MIVLMSFIFGDAALRALNIPVGPNVEAILENRTAIIGMLFFLSSIVQNVSETGAFEISVNGVVMFSKLQSGRFPAAEDIANIMERAGVQNQGQYQNI